MLHAGTLEGLICQQKEVSEFGRKFYLEIVGILDTMVLESRLQTMINNCLPGWRIEHKY